MNNSDQNQVIEDMQIRLAYQEDTLGELARQIVQQQSDIGALKIQVQHLNKKLISVGGGSDTGGSYDDNQRPPHY